MRLTVLAGCLQGLVNAFLGKNYQDQAAELRFAPTIPSCTMGPRLYPQRFDPSLVSSRRSVVNEAITAGTDEGARAAVWKVALLSGVSGA